MNPSRSLQFQPNTEATATMHEDIGDEAPRVDDRSAIGTSTLLMPFTGNAAVRPIGRPPFPPQRGDRGYAGINSLWPAVPTSGSWGWAALSNARTWNAA